MNPIKYCPQCGNLLDSRVIDQKKRPYCNHCQILFY
ncbi:MAG: hypothetical protein EU552_02835 [Promethearchaeota archaeon]|nr:MAG: hypothetical protein EU552_02835 [Candidatus Lokiarchaeota archaeon]